jgi:hypothetical protein
MAARTVLLRLSVDSDHHSQYRLAEAIRAVLRKADQTLIHRYQPERYYMRGPGPRWHAKNGQAAQAVEHAEG